MEANELVGKQIFDTEKRKYNITGILGEGGQGMVLRTAEGFLIKINTLPDKEKYIERYKWLLKRSSALPKETRIAFPIAILAEPYIGYVMYEAKGHSSLDIYINKPDEISSFTDWYFNASNGIIKRLQIGAMLAKSLRYLHINGYSYVDISPNNILVAKNKNSIAIIDSDNITSGVFTPLISGTPGYIAPEILTKNAAINSLTDTYSYAVLLFQMLTGCHPFIGDDLEDSNPDELEKAYRGEYPYIGDENVHTNKNSVYEETKIFINEELSELFKRSFIDGSVDGTQRPTLMEFMKACRKAEQMVIKCESDGCDAEYYYEENVVCPLCGNKIVNPPMLQVHEQIISRNEILMPYDNNMKFSKLPVINQGKGNIILKSNFNYIHKSDFDENLPFDLDEIILVVRMNQDKSLSLYNLSKGDIYVLNREIKKPKILSPYSKGKSEKDNSAQLSRGEDLIILDNNINIAIDGEKLDVSKVEEYYGEVVIRKYLVVM